MTMSKVKSMIDRVFNANGIYDMSGCAIDDVAVYIQGALASSGFTSHMINILGLDVEDIIEMVQVQEYVMLEKHIN